MKQTARTFDGEDELHVARAGDGGRRAPVGALVRRRHVRNYQRAVVGDHIRRYLAVHLGPVKRCCPVVCTTAATQPAQ